MPTYKIIFTPTAERDYRNIMRYFRDEIRSPQAFEKIAKSIKKNVALISELPHAFPVVEAIYYRDVLVRKCATDKYLLFYALDESDASVYLLHILHHR